MRFTKALISLMGLWVFAPAVSFGQIEISKSLERLLPETLIQESASDFLRPIIAVQDATNFTILSEILQTVEKERLLSHDVKESLKGHISQKMKERVNKQLCEQLQEAWGVIEYLDRLAKDMNRYIASGG